MTPCIPTGHWRSRPAPERLSCWGSAGPIATSSGERSLSDDAPVRLLKGTPILKEGAKTAAGRRTIRLTDGIADARSRSIGTVSRRDGVLPQTGSTTTSSSPPAPAGRSIPSHVRRAFDRLVSQAGVKRLTPHGMRKSHITALIAGGANIKAVAARVGHRDITTTLKTYTALTPSMQDELHSLVESLASCAPSNVPR